MGHADSVTNDERGSQSDISDRSSSNPITRVIKLTLPTPTISLYDHSFICCHSYIHTRIHTNHSFIPYIRSIAYAVKCITTLRVASRSGSCLIQHEQRPTGVRRPAHEGLKAASRRIEPGEKTQMSPSSLCLTHLEVDRVISTFSCQIPIGPS